MTPRRRGSGAAAVSERSARSPRPRNRRLPRRSTRHHSLRAGVVGSPPLPGSRRGWAWAGCSRREVSRKWSALSSWPSLPPPPSQLHGDAGEGAESRNRFAAGVPAGFDVERFLNEAKRNFVRLQEANDRGDLALLREVTTGELFDALKDDLASHPGSQTDVVTLNAALLELVTKGGLHWASVRFSGSIREQAGAPAAPFEEIWNLQKPADGSSGWLLAGIQQLS